MIETAVQGTLRLIDALDGPAGRAWCWPAAFRCTTGIVWGQRSTKTVRCSRPRRLRCWGDYALAKLMQELAAREAFAQHARALTRAAAGRWCGMQAIEAWIALDREQASGAASSPRAAGCI